MNNTLKHDFSLFQNEESLRYAIELVCAKYAKGKITSLRIFPASRDPRTGGRQCICLLQLDPPKAQAALRLQLKVSVDASDLAFLADVDEKWSGPRMKTPNSS